MVLVVRFGLGGSVGVCVAWDIQGVAGVALTALGLLWWRGWGWRALQDFAWHAWHLMTLTLLLCRQAAWAGALANTYFFDFLTPMRFPTRYTGLARSTETLRYR